MNIIFPDSLPFLTPGKKKQPPIHASIRRSLAFSMNTAQGDRDVHAQSVIFRHKVNPLNLWCRQVESQRKVKKH